MEVRQVWQLLLQADDLLERAVVLRGPGPAPAAPPTSAPAPEAPPAPAPAPTAPPVVEPASYRPYPAPAAPQRVQTTAPSWSVGTILLALGAFGLIAAGLIFVTRSWEDIGLAGRTLMLLGITAIIGGLGVWVTRRPLRASAEAVWTVFLTLLTLDFFAARHEDLVGLRALDVAGGLLVWGVIALALSVAISVWSRRSVASELVAPAIAGGLAIAIGGFGAGSVPVEWDFAWRAVLALVVSGLLALATRPAALPHMTLVARVVFAGFYSAAYTAALAELVDHSSMDELVGNGHGIPLLLMGIASLVVAWVVPIVRVPGVALAVLAAAVLVATPVADAGGDEAFWIVLAALASVLAVAGTRGRNPWMLGLRIGAAPVIVAFVVIHLVLLVEVLQTVVRVLEHPQRFPWDQRLDVLGVADHAAWAIPFVAVGLVVVVAFVPRWPELAAVRPHATALTATAVGLAILNGAVAWHLPVWTLVAALLAYAGAVLALHLRGRLTSLGSVAILVVLVAAGLAAASPGVSAWGWLLGGGIVGSFALARHGGDLRLVHAMVSVPLLLLGAAATAELIASDDAVTALAALVGALALVAAAGTVLREQASRPAIELTAAVGGVVALVWAGSSSDLALRWTVAGVVLIALRFVVADRRWYLWPGIGALVVAYLIVVFESDFGFVEAYTLPLGAAALGAGLYVAQSKPDLGTWTCLGPGLALAMLPSVPQALGEPTELRALLLGVGALVALTVGVRRGWQGPFVTGAAIAVLLVLFNIGPYANAAPRVVLIAAGSAILMGIGITWEDRVRDGRKLVGYVRSMR